MKMLRSELFEAHTQPSVNSFPYSATSVCLSQEHSLSIHWHDRMEIIIIREGCGIISIDLELVPVHKGDICIVLPNQLHAATAQSGGLLKLEIIHFPLSMLTNSNTEDDTLRYFQPLEKGEQVIPWLVTPDYLWYPAFSQCLEEMTQLHTYYPTAYPLAIKSKLFQLFYILFYNEPKVMPKSRPQKSVQKTKQIISYITEHYREPLTMEQMARVCGFSESHFMKFFKSTIGITFTECLNNYRLSRAYALLPASDASISEVAAACGFDNTSYFNRLFKRKYGITPTSLRQQSMEPYLAKSCRDNSSYAKEA